MISVYKFEMFVAGRDARRTGRHGGHDGSHGDTRGYRGSRPMV